MPKVSSPSTPRITRSLPTPAGAPNKKTEALPWIPRATAERTRPAISVRPWTEVSKYSEGLSDTERSLRLGRRPVSEPSTGIPREGVIGPLINPAKARNHTLGVYQPELVPMIAKVAAEMDFNHVLVSHGMDGLDELSLLGKTSIADVRGGEVRYDEVVPEDFGFKRCSIEDIAGGSPEYNAKVITELFAGRERGPKRDFLVLNNAATLYVSGRAASIADGIAQAEDLLDSGAATAKLAELVSATRAL